MESPLLSPVAVPLISNLSLVKEFSLSMTIALALILHKLPETFSVSTYLIYKKVSTLSTYILILVLYY